MPPIYLFEDSHTHHLNPLTYSRPVWALRCGGATLLERATRMLGVPPAGLLVRDTLAEVARQLTGIAVNPGVSTREGVVLINARWLMLEKPFAKLPEPDTAGLAASAIVWVHLSPERAAELDFGRLLEARTLEAVLPGLQRTTAAATLINRPWDLIAHQRAAIVADFAHLGAAAESAVPARAHVLEERNVHIAAGVRVYPGVVIDAEEGPVIVQEGAVIKPHAVLTGPLVVGPHATVRTAADIREDTTIGPHCRVGGEVIGSIFLGYGNKQHHGFVGQSVIGEWANLGAGTTTSNLKNTYGTIRMALTGTEEETGRQFLGSIVADHAKLGIGTYLSTGSVVGFASHVVAPRPPKFVPSFAWVTEKEGRAKVERIDFEKVVALAGAVMGRRKMAFTAADHALFVMIASDMAPQEAYAWADAKA